MDEQLHPSGRTEEPSYWGNCPECRGTDGWVNIDWAFWFVCEQHQVRWHIPRNIPGREEWECFQADQ